MNKMKIFSGRLKYVFIAFALVVILLSATRDERNFSISKSLSIYATLFRELDMFYVDAFEPQELVEKSIKNLLEELDPYTVFYSEKSGDKLTLLTKGEYGGIGSMVSTRNNKVRIVQVYEGTPSQKYGLKAGDEILSIDGKPLKGKAINHVSDLLKGKANTFVELKIKRFANDKPLHKKLKRQIIKLPSLPYYGMLDNSVGYIYFSRFTNNSSNDVRKALIDLKTEGATSIILDLRSNPGGLLGEAAKITNFFISKGDTIVSTKGRIKKMNHSYIATTNPIMPNMPLVVLVGRSSASASEIVAGAMQDLDRGLIIGQRSFGKGLVQTTRDLVYNTKLKLTTAKYYTPSGRCVQALDYSHRNEDGSVGNIPDSLISEFRTKNGRIVYDGGGVTPDITIKNKEYSTISKKLVINDIIFNFATEYLSSNKVNLNETDFDVDKKIFFAFKQYLIDTKFKYNSGAELNLKKLEKVAKEEKYYNLAKPEFDALRKKLSHSLERDLDVFSSEIKDILAIELLKREKFDRGAIKYHARHDIVIDSALVVLKNLKRYNKILGK